MARGSSNSQKSQVVEQQSDASKKLESIKMAMDQIEKQYGRGSIMRFGEAAQKFDISVISTGCLPLDLALGAGGLPRGRIIEIYGPMADAGTNFMDPNCTFNNHHLPLVKSFNVSTISSHFEASISLSPTRSNFLAKNLAIAID